MNVAIPGMAELGMPELIIIVLVVLLLFGGKKLPEMARGTGRALRIFKAETKGLMTDDESDPPQSPVPQPPLQQSPLPQSPVDPPLTSA
jgi:sec-independent protein translocase protein TatA